VFSFEPQRGQTRFFSLSTNFVRGRVRIFSNPSVSDLLIYSFYPFCIQSYPRSANTGGYFIQLSPIIAGQ